LFGSLPTILLFCVFAPEPGGIAIGQSMAMRNLLPKLKTICQIDPVSLDQSALKRWKDR
jgi:hypothetical protein